MNVKTLLLSLPLVCVVAACGANKMTSPSPALAVPPPPPAPVVPACEANHTSEVRFGNRFQNTTLTVSWDGGNVATLAPGQDSDPRTVAAGVAGNPIPNQCGAHYYTCG